jgi:hypothetical protein
MRTEVEHGHLPWKLDRSLGMVASTHAASSSSTAQRRRPCWAAICAARHATRTHATAAPLCGSAQSRPGGRRGRVRASKTGQSFPVPATRPFGVTSPASRKLRRQHSIEKNGCAQRHKRRSQHLMAPAQALTARRAFAGLSIPRASARHAALHRQATVNDASGPRRGSKAARQQASHRQPWLLRTSRAKRSMARTRQDELDIARPGVVAHEADAKNLAYRGAEAAADLQVVLTHDVGRNVAPHDAVRHLHGGHRRQPRLGVLHKKL